MGGEKLRKNAFTDGLNPSVNGVGDARYEVFFCILDVQLLLKTIMEVSC